MLDLRPRRAALRVVARLAVAIALGVVTLAGLATSDVLAQADGSGAAAAVVDLEEYVPADPSLRQETVSASLMVTLAYTLMWLAVVVFLVAMLRRSQGLRADVEAARTQLAKLDERIERMVRRGGGET
jgi:hypothetical protein